METLADPWVEEFDEPMPAGEAGCSALAAGLLQIRSFTERDTYRRGFNRESAEDLAKVIHEEAAVGAVAITDTEKVLAFVGYGSDHHLPGEPIASALTREAIEENRVVFVDGVRASYACPLSKDCPLHSVLVVPLEVDGRVIGTIKLYERASQRLFGPARPTRR